MSSWSQADGKARVTYAERLMQANRSHQKVNHDVDSGAQSLKEKASDRAAEQSPKVARTEGPTASSVTGSVAVLTGNAKVGKDDLHSATEVQTSDAGVDRASMASSPISQVKVQTRTFHSDAWIESAGEAQSLQINRAQPPSNIWETRMKKLAEHRSSDTNASAQRPLTERSCSPSPPKRASVASHIADIDNVWLQRLSLVSNASQAQHMEEHGAKQGDEARSAQQDRGVSTTRAAQTSTSQSPPGGWPALHQVPSTASKVPLPTENKQRPSSADTVFEDIQGVEIKNGATQRRNGKQWHELVPNLTFKQDPSSAARSNQRALPRGGKKGWKGSKNRETSRSTDPGCKPRASHVPLSGESWDAKSDTTHTLEAAESRDTNGSEVLHPETSLVYPPPLVDHPTSDVLEDALRSGEVPAHNTHSPKSHRPASHQAQTSPSASTQAWDPAPCAETSILTPFRLQGGYQKQSGASVSRRPEPLRNTKEETFVAPDKCSRHTSEQETGWCSYNSLEGSPENPAKGHQRNARTDGAVHSQQHADRSNARTARLSRGSSHLRSPPDHSPVDFRRNVDCQYSGRFPSHAPLPAWRGPDIPRNIPIVASDVQHHSKPVAPWMISQVHSHPQGYQGEGDVRRGLGQPMEPSPHFGPVEYACPPRDAGGPPMTSSALQSPSVGLSYPHCSPRYALPGPAGQLVQQIEFYFSPQNLQSDFFLRQQMDASSGWVPLSLILSFKRLRKMSEELCINLDTPQVIEGLLKSPLLEVDVDHRRLRIREGWRYWLLRRSDGPTHPTHLPPNLPIGFTPLPAHPEAKAYSHTHHHSHAAQHPMDQNQPTIIPEGRGSPADSRLHAVDESGLNCVYPQPWRLCLDSADANGLGHVRMPFNSNASPSQYPLPPQCISTTPHQLGPPFRPSYPEHASMPNAPNASIGYQRPNHDSIPAFASEQQQRSESGATRETSGTALRIASIDQSDEGILQARSLPSYERSQASLPPCQAPMQTTQSGDCADNEPTALVDDEDESYDDAEDDDDEALGIVAGEGLGGLVTHACK